MENTDTDVEAIVAHVADARDVWQAISVLVLLLLSACGDNLCGCPFGTVCRPMPSKEGYACIPAPQAQDADDAR